MTGSPSPSPVSLTQMQKVNVSWLMNSLGNMVNIQQAVGFSVAANVITVNYTTGDIGYTYPDNDSANIDFKKLLRALITLDLRPKGALALTSLSPATGGIAGGESIILYGTGFSSNMTCVFDTTFDAGPVTVLDVDTAIVQAPAHAAGVVDVSVVNNQEISTLVGGYTYA